MLDVRGNHRMTAIVSGLALIPLLAVEGYTIPRIRFHLQLHLFFGFWVMAPLLLKMASSGWRFLRYYTRNPAFHAAGPPGWGPRLLAPVVVVSTVVLFVSGIGLWWIGPSSEYGSWFEWHKASFVVWFFATAAHVLYHLEETPREIVEEVRARSRGRVTRGGLLLASLLLGLVLAAVLTPVHTGWLD